MYTLDFEDRLELFFEGINENKTPQEVVDNNKLRDEILEIEVERENLKDYVETLIYNTKFKLTTQIATVEKQIIDNYDTSIDITLRFKLAALVEEVKDLNRNAPQIA